MNTHPIEAKVGKCGAGSTTLLIRAGNAVVAAEYAEMAPCEFPVWSSSPIAVEVPPNGTKDFVVGPFTGEVTQKRNDGSYPDIIKFPVYRAQDVIGLSEFRDGGDANGSRLLAKVPVIAIATECSGKVDDRWAQVHSVLPIWNDGSAVVVTLDRHDGEPAEGTPNPEYRLQATRGLPVAAGLARLVRRTRPPVGAQACRYRLYLTPWLLGRELLADPGAATAHRIWQRQWEFASPEEFTAAVSRLAEGLAGARVDLEAEDVTPTVQR